MWQDHAMCISLKRMYLMYLLYLYICADKQVFLDWSCKWKRFNISRVAYGIVNFNPLYYKIQVDSIWLLTWLHALSRWRPFIVYPRVWWGEYIEEGVIQCSPCPICRTCLRINWKFLSNIWKSWIMYKVQYKQTFNSNYIVRHSHQLRLD